MTNRNLINFHNEIQGWYEQGSVLVMLNRSKIKEFDKNNKHKVEEVHKKINALHENFLVYEQPKDKDGNPDMSKPLIIKYEGGGNDRKLVFQKGKTNEQFQKEYAELMDTEIIINF